MNPAQATHPSASRTYSPLVRGFQALYLGTTGLFAACIALQAYLAGLSIFADGRYMAGHSALGFVLQFITLLMLPLALLGRFPLRIIGLHGLLLLDIVFQVGLVTFLRGLQQPMLTAAHAANALVLFLLAVTLAVRAGRWRRQVGLPAGQATNPPRPA